MKINLCLMPVLMLLAAQGQTFGMRQVMSKTGSQAGASLAVAGSASALSASLRSLHGSLKATEKIDQSSQKEDQGFRSDTKSDQRKKWYQNKYVQVGGWGLGACALHDQYQVDCKTKKEFEDELALMFKETKDLAALDPKLYAACLKIKEDMGIEQNVYFRVADSVYDYGKMISNNYTGVFVSIKKAYEESAVPTVNALVLNPNYATRSKTLVLSTIVHELEHCRQRNRLLGSYHVGSTKKQEDALRMETGADAAAADYLYCFECLGEMSKSKGWHHDPQETEHGYFTSPKGYFSQKDYEIYADRARKDCALCYAHKGPWGFVKQPKHNEPWMNFLPRSVSFNS